MKRMNGGEMVRDAVVLIGAGSLIYGTWLVWRPLGFMLVGITLMAFAILWEIDRQRKPGRDTEQTRHHPRDLD